MTDATLQGLFMTGLQDIYYAEQQILKTLPEMQRAATSEDLRAAFTQHIAETEAQVGRLQQVFEILGVQAQGKQCPAIDGIITEGAEVLQTFAGRPALDAGLIAAAQAVEHYEIARYGTLKRWAVTLGLDDAAALLDETLTEEWATDDALTEIAEESVNESALVEAA